MRPFTIKVSCFRLFKVENFFIYNVKVKNNRKVQNTVLLLFKVKQPKKYIIKFLVLALKTSFFNYFYK